MQQNYHVPTRNGKQSGSADASHSCPYGFDAVTNPLANYCWEADLFFSAAPTSLSKTLHITNFNIYVNELIMGDVFRHIGQVVSIDIHWHVFGYRYARVTFHSWYCAEKALKEYNDMDLGDGYKWQLSYAFHHLNYGPISPEQFRAEQRMRNTEGYVRISLLPKLVTEPYVYNLFEHNGDINELVLLSCLGRPLGHAIIRFATEEQGLQSVRNHNQVLNGGMWLLVEYVQEMWHPLAHPQLASTPITTFSRYRGRFAAGRSRPRGRSTTKRRF